VSHTYDERNVVELFGAKTGYLGVGSRLIGRLLRQVRPALGRRHPTAYNAPDRPINRNSAKARTPSKQCRKSTQEILKYMSSCSCSCSGYNFKRHWVITKMIGVGRVTLLYPGLGLALSECKQWRSLIMQK